MNFNHLATWTQADIDLLAACAATGVDYLDYDPTDYTDDPA